jgi:hypothetical protein
MRDGALMSTRPALIKLVGKVASVSERLCEKILATPADFNFTEVALAEELSALRARLEMYETANSFTAAAIRTTIHVRRKPRGAMGDCKPRALTELDLERVVVDKAMRWADYSTRNALHDLEDACKALKKERAGHG